MILEALKNRTAAHHEAIERTLDLMSPGMSRERYIAILEGFLAFYRSYEAALESVPGLPADRLDLEGRRKSHLIEKDLRALGLEPSPSKADGSLPELKTAAQALGSLYVMEGSTLGGQFITRALGPRLDLSPERGCAFFNGYGKETGSRWNAFRAVLVEEAPRLDSEAIVASACETFEKLDSWFKSQSN